MSDHIREFYESEWLDGLVGDMHHPGGTKLVKEIGRMCAIDDRSKVLDIGCGSGATTVEIAHSFGCRIMGLDISPTLLDEARETVRREGLKGVHFRLTDGDIPLLPESDAVLFISSLSLFSDKLEALRSARMNLKKGGRIIIANITVSENLPNESSGHMMFDSCISGALTFHSTIRLIELAGFDDIVTKDWTHELQRQWGTTFMRSRLKSSKRSPLGSVRKGAKVSDFLQKAEKLFDNGLIGYHIFTARR